MSLIDCLGRELFMTDKTLNESDLKFLADAGDTAVTVDESLFEVRDKISLAKPVPKGTESDYKYLFVGLYVCLSERFY